MKNVVNLIGNLGSDVEVVNFDNGNKIAKFSMATSQSWKDKQSSEKQTETQWHRIVVPSFLTDNVEKYLSKGDKIDLEGMIKYKNYEKEDGTKVYFTEIHAKSILFLTTKGTNETSEKPKKNVASDDESDDLPF